jgi:alpha-tubulin suppressor-like RCC1 family protein
LDNIGKVFSFGDNTFGQLGTNSFIETHLPMFIMNNINKISTGCYHSLLLTNNNQVYSFGSNSNGQLGLNLPILLNSTINQPTQLSIPNSNSIVQISCGNYHCLLLSKSGLVFTFGFNLVILTLIK